MTILALNDLNVSAELDSQALTAVSGGHWVKTGQSSTTSGSWMNSGRFTIYHNSVHYGRGYRSVHKLGYQRRFRVQRHTDFYKWNHVTYG